MSTYRFTGAPAFVTVSTTGDYDIVAFGAQGGGTTSAKGGYGAEVGGTVHLTAGEKLEIVVGGQGGNGDSLSGGGGGGSFVLANIGGTYQPLVVAGGGGGARGSASGGYGRTSKGAVSGTVGQGGAGGATGGYSGAGGSGYKSDGKNGTSPNGPAAGGSNRTGNYAGGTGEDPTTGFGGFGGGGGGINGGGGGGGYSGGAGGASGSAGGGGGSYDTGIPIASQTQSGYNDGNGRIIISPDATCFCTGMRIRTTRGDVAVEELRIGERVVTTSGDHRPIRWIGHRRIDARQDGRGGTLPHDQRPVRIRRGAFGQDADGAAIPARDLMLSPGHPVLVGADAEGEGGVLVPIMCLVNGTTVARMPLTSVTYWHVELDAHDILLAEGLPAESYLDWGDRAFFDEASDHALANPDFVVPGLAGRCRPVALGGPVVEAERLRLDAVFAAALAAQCGWGEATRWASA